MVKYNTKKNQSDRRQQSSKSTQSKGLYQAVKPLDRTLIKTKIKLKVNKIKYLCDLCIDLDTI